MKLYQAGEKSKAICRDCGKLVGTTFAYRDVPFDDGPGVVPGILAAVCDECDRVVAVPAQSTPAIRRSRLVATKSVEANLPAPYLEILDLAAARIDPTASTDMRKLLLVYFLQMQESREAGRDWLDAVLRTIPELSMRADRLPKRRLSMKVTQRTQAELDSLVTRCGGTRTKVLKGLVAEIRRDIVDPAKPKRLGELRRLAMVAAA